MDYEFKITQQELQVIYHALGDMPLKLSLNVFTRLQQQQQQQDNDKAVHMDASYKQG